jgi:hypothetical protein
MQQGRSLGQIKKRKACAYVRSSAPAAQAGVMFEDDALRPPAPNADFFVIGTVFVGNKIC